MAWLLWPLLVVALVAGARSPIIYILIRLLFGRK